MKCLILGDRGFVGVHLEEALEKLEYDVVGFDLKTGGDVTDYEQVRLKIDKCQPDYIYHLASMTAISESQLNPYRAIQTQIVGSLNVLEAVRQLNIRCKILFASTAEEYGYEHQKQVITEDSPTLPITIYGATKNAMTNLTRIYNKQYGLHVVITRAFSHIGAGKTAQFAEAAWAKQIALIERGQEQILKHGNLETVRNYTDVRDIVRAYIAAIDAEPGIYNVCSDNNVSMAEMLDKLIENADCEIPTEVDEQLYRPGTATYQSPSYEKLKKATDWKPRISFDNSVKDLLDDWRSRVI